MNPESVNIGRCSNNKTNGHSELYTVNSFTFLILTAMKTLNLNEKSFQLENDVFKFLHDYIERINDFVAKNQIDTDLHQDILQRLADKLSEKENKKGWITQKIAIQIVNDLWEPEEIFAEEEFSSSNAVNSPNAWKDELEKEKAKTFYEKLQKNQRSRPQETAILLWVCGMFAQGTGWNVRFWRGITLFASYVFLASEMGILFFWGVIAYILLALIFPIKEKNYGERSVFSYFLTQIWDLTLIFTNSIKFWFKSVKRILGRAIPNILKRLSTLFWPFWNFVKICFLLLRSAFLTLVLGILGILLYYLRNWYVWNNVEMTSIFPAITSWGVALGFLSALLLLLGSIGTLFKKKLMNTASLIAAIVSGIFAMIIAGITGINVFYTFHNSQKEILNKELIIPLPDDGHALTIHVDYLNNNFQVLPFNEIIEENKIINYIPYEWDAIKAVFTYNIYTKNKETFTKISKSISNPIYEIRDGMLNIYHKNYKLFDEIVPLIPMEYSVDLYIPKNWKFNISNSLHSNNLHKPERTNKWGYYDPYYDEDMGKCSDWISYDEKENAFFCPMELDLEKFDVRGAIDRDIRNNKADELSPLKGLNRDWSEAYYSYGQYWNLHSILWKDNQHFIVKLSDQMFNIFLEVEAKVHENWEISYTKSKVKEIEQKGNITPERMKLYKGRENLKEFKPHIKTIEDEQERDNKEEKVSKEKFDALVKKLEEKGILDND